MSDNKNLFIAFVLALISVTILGWQLGIFEAKYNYESWKEIIPESCQTFSDGCNRCQRMTNGDALCTLKGCEKYKRPVCLD